MYFDSEFFSDQESLKIQFPLEIDSGKSSNLIAWVMPVGPLPLSQEGVSERLLRAF